MVYWTAVESWAAGKPCEFDGIVRYIKDEETLFRAVDNGLPVKTIYISSEYRNRHLAKLPDVEEVTTDPSYGFGGTLNLTGLDLSLLPKLRKLHIPNSVGISRCPDDIEDLDIGGKCDIFDVSNCRNLRKLQAYANERLASVPTTLEYLDISWTEERGDRFADLLSCKKTKGPRLSPDVLRSLRSLKTLIASNNPTVTACPDTLTTLWIDYGTGLNDSDVMACRELRTLSVTENERITVCPPWVTTLHVAHGAITDLKDCVGITELEIHGHSPVRFYPPSLKRLVIQQGSPDTNIETCTSLKDVTCEDLNGMRLPMSVEEIHVICAYNGLVDLRSYTNLRKVTLERVSSAALPPSVKELSMERAKAVNLDECSALEVLDACESKGLKEIPESVVRLTFSVMKLPKILDLRHCTKLRYLDIDDSKTELYIPNTVETLVNANSATVHRI